MLTKKAIEEGMARLRGLAPEAWPADADKTLREALRRGSNLLAGRAAALAAEHPAGAFGPDLVAAFDRFMYAGDKSDPGCLAKWAIVDALRALEHEDDGVYLRGVRHVQMEPVWGKRVDTAANLRGNCGLALASVDHPLAPFELAALLMDPEPSARRSAIKALAYLGRKECELMLRVKALAGDAEPDILGECLAALMQIHPERSLPFVTRFLEREDPSIVEGAALAIGESRTPEALRVLLDFWQMHFDRESRKMLALPIALTRCDEAFEFLLDVAADQPAALAAAAIAALPIFGDGPENRARVETAIALRSEAEIVKAYAEAFAPKG